MSRAEPGRETHLPGTGQEGGNRLWPALTLAGASEELAPASILRDSLGLNPCLKPIVRLSQDHETGLVKGSVRSFKYFSEARSSPALQTSFSRVVLKESLMP